VETEFEARGLSFRKEDEYASANYYSNVLDAGEHGKIQAELAACTWRPASVSASHAEF
jgi:hypothetical protein